MLVKVVLQTNERAELDLMVDLVIASTINVADLTAHYSSSATIDEDVIVGAC